MTDKILRVRLEFTLKPDKFGLHSVPNEVQVWLDGQDVSAKSLPNCTMTIDPVVDAEGAGLQQVRVRTRGPNKPKDAAPIPAQPSLVATAPMASTDAMMSRAAQDTARIATKAAE